MESRSPKVMLQIVDGNFEKRHAARGSLDQIYLQILGTQAQALQEPEDGTIATILLSAAMRDEWFDDLPDVIERAKRISQDLRRGIASMTGAIQTRTPHKR